MPRSATFTKAQAWRNIFKSSGDNPPNNNNNTKNKDSVFKLADRMRSMRTNGASKNRDSWSFLVVPSKLLSIRIIFGTYGMYAY